MAMPVHVALTTNISTSRLGRKENLSPQQETNPRPPEHQGRCSSCSHRVTRTHGVQDNLTSSSCVTSILHTLRSIVLSGNTTVYLTNSACSHGSMSCLVTDALQFTLPSGKMEKQFYKSSIPKAKRKIAPEISHCYLICWLLIMKKKQKH